MTPTTPAIDVSLWLGQYPFRGIPNSTLDDLEARLGALNIEHAVVSPLEAVFWENSLDAFDRLADEISGTDTFDVWPVLRPGALHGIEKLLDRYKPRGLRLTPNYHHYRLSDPAVEPILSLARERKLVVQVFQRLADERWHHLLKVPPVDPTDFDYLTAVHGDLPILLSGVQPLAPLAPRLRQLPSLYADLSRVRAPDAAIEQLVKTLPPDKLLFGSLWPIQIIEATLWQITTANLDDPTRANLLRNNAQKLLNR
jgi:predicted TIM-barrel fold metal-dependent hydrolase